MICPYIMLLYIIYIYIYYIYLYIYIYIYITKRHVKFREFEVNGFKGHVRTMFGGSFNEVHDDLLRDGHDFGDSLLRAYKSI